MIIYHPTHKAYDTLDELIQDIGKTRYNRAIKHNEVTYVTAERR